MRKLWAVSVCTLAVAGLGACATKTPFVGTPDASTAPVVIEDASELAPGAWLEGEPLTFFGTGMVRDGRLYLTSPNGTERMVLDATSSWTGILDKMSPILDGIDGSVKAWPSRDDPSVLLASEVLPYERSGNFVMGRARLQDDQVVLQVQGREWIIDDEELTERIKPFTPEVSPGSYNAGTGFIIQGDLVQDGDTRRIEGQPQKVWMLTAPNGYATSEAVRVGDYTVVTADVPNGSGKVLTYSSVLTPDEINSHDIGYQRDRARAMTLGMPRFAEEVPEAIRTQFPNATRFYEMEQLLWTQQANLVSTGRSPNTNVVLPASDGTVCMPDGTDPVACLLEDLPGVEPN